MATIADVARKAGVSRTAVSFAFNKQEQLSAETLQRILGVAHDLGYYPNPAARSLNTGRTGIVGLLIPQRTALVCSNPFILEFLRGMGQVSDRHGLSILLVSPVRGSLTHAMNNVPVDGFIALGLGAHQREVGLLCRRRVPFVVVDAQAPEGISSITVDDMGGAAAIAGHVLDAGHRDVLVIAMRPPKGDDDLPATSDTAYDTSHRRLCGYRHAFEARGLTLPPERVIYADATLDGGASALRAAWQGGHRPTAVLAMSDVAAFGAIAAARQQGLRVPDDLSVAGFDDVFEAVHSTPALTTVHQPIAEKGKQAAQLLVERLAGKVEPAHRVLRTMLMARDTVAPPRR